MKRIVLIMALAVACMAPAMAQERAGKGKRDPKQVSAMVARKLNFTDAQKAQLDNYQLNFSKAISITNANDADVKDKYLNEVPAWASNAAEVASILYQDPILFARHAGEMLNEELLNL